MKKKVSLKSHENILLLCADKLTLQKEPIVYRDEYNIKFLGFEKKFVMDSAKFSKIINKLKEFKIITRKKNFIKPKMIPEFFITNWNTAEYLKDLKDLKKIGHILEISFRTYIERIPIINKISDSNLVTMVEKIIFSGYKYQSCGSILAGELAMIYGFAINVGGGQHHAAAHEGGGWCVFSDIQMCVENLCFQEKAKKILIIDLDAHQGNGYELDKVNKRFSIPSDDIYIIDIYNKNKYPSDIPAKAGINVNVEISSYTRNEEYINHVINSLKKAESEFQPDFVVYNAGTDVLKGDTLGGLQISDETIIERDYLVMKWFTSKQIPIVYFTSGGYSKDSKATPKGSATIIAESIRNMYEKLGLSQMAEFNFQKKFLCEKVDDMMSPPLANLEEDPDFKLREVKKLELPKLERIDEKLVLKLESLGYDNEKAVEAITMSRNHLGKAKQYLIEKYGEDKKEIIDSEEQG